MSLPLIDFSLDSMRNPFQLLIFFLLTCCPISGTSQISLPDLGPDRQRLQHARFVETIAILSLDSVLLGKAYFLLAEVFNGAGQKTSCSDYYLKTIRVLAPRGNFYELGMAHLRLNQGLAQTGGEQLSNIQSALSIFRKIHSPKGMAHAYNFMTSTLKGRWIWKKEEVKHLTAHPGRISLLIQTMNNIEYCARLANDTTTLTEAYLQKGDFYRNLKDKQAYKYYDYALGLSSQSRNDTSTIHIIAHIAAFHLDMGNYPAAGVYINRLQRMANKSFINDFWLNSHVLQACRDYYSKTDQWRNVVDCLVALEDYQNVRQEGDHHLASSINLKYETEKKDALLRVQQSELRNFQIQRRMTAAISTLLLMAAATSVLFFRLNRKNKRISRQNQELVKEQNHRVKNNLQVVSSLLSLQANQLTDTTARQAIEESHLRIQSMAILHHKLYDGNKLAKVDLQEFIPELISGVLQTFGAHRVDVLYDIDPCYLTADKATPLGLILNELTTNSCKYAYVDNPFPKLRISCKRNNRTIHLEVGDNGPGLALGLETTISLDQLLKYESGTFGIPLIQSQVAQLYSICYFHSNQNPATSGTTFSVSFKI